MGRPKMNKPPTPCTVEGCDRMVRSVGLCSRHYDRMRLYGRLERIKPEPGTGLAWLRERVSSAVPNECVEWPFARISAGRYGVVWFDGAQQLAHRVSLTIATGMAPRPSDYVLHSCDNPGCVNPHHLRVGTPMENSADAVARNRCSRGSQRPLAKLTEDAVLRIRSSPLNGVELARQFGVSPATISNVKNRKVWTHI